MELEHENLEALSLAIFQVFGKRYSCIYDIESILEVIKKESTPRDLIQILIQLLHLSSSFAQFFSTEGRKDMATSYSSYFEHMKKKLTLSSFNELFQMFKVDESCLLGLFKLLNDS